MNNHPVDLRKKYNVIFAPQPCRIMHATNMFYVSIHFELYVTVCIVFFYMIICSAVHCTRVNFITLCISVIRLIFKNCVEICSAKTVYHSHRYVLTWTYHILRFVK